MARSRQCRRPSFILVLDSVDFGSNASLQFLFSEANDAGLLGKASLTISLIGEGIEATTPLPAALPLFASGLGALGLLGWRRKKKAAAIPA
jgi:hypothetical protein